jgi:hypothetical protein
MNADDRDYYLKRISQEDQAARDATSLAARWRHEELACLYRVRLLAFDRSVREGEDPGIVQPFIVVPDPPQTEAA